MANDPVSVLALEPTIDSTSGLLDLLGRTGQIEIFPIPNPAEALQAALQFAPCVLLLSLTGAEDGREKIELLQRLEKNIKSGQLKVLIVSAVKNHPLAPDFTALGITDFAEDPVPVRALLFKMNLAVKAVLALRRQTVTAKRDGDTIVFKADGAAKEQAVKIDSRAGGVSTSYKPALQLGEDIFVFRNTPPRKHGRKMVLQAEGPDPETGSWRPAAKTRGAGGEALWRWVPKPGTENETAPAEANSGWVCAGDQPEFNEYTKKWQFRSEKPQLFHQRSGQVTGRKVNVNENGEVEIAEDSEQAERNLATNRDVAAKLREAKIRAAREKGRGPRSADESGTRAETGEDHAPEEQSGREEIAEEGGVTRAAKAGPSPRESEAGKEEPAENSPAPRRLSAGSGAGEEPDGDPVLLSSEKSKRLLSRKRRARTGRNAEAEGAGALGEDEGAQRAELTGEPPAQEEDKGNRAPGSGDAPGEERIDRAKETRAAGGKAARGEDAEENGEEASRPKHLRAPPATGATGEGEPRSAPPAQPQRPARGPQEIRARERARAKAQARLKELQAEARAEADAPLAESLDPGEERRLRHELALNDRPDLGPRELAKQAWLARLRSLRKAMKDIQESLDGQGATPEALFPEGEEERAPSPDVPHARKFRAIESIAEEARDDFFTPPESRKKNRKGKPEEATPAADSFFYLSRDEVAPRDGLWEGDDPEWIYLPESVFENGFESLEVLLPTWLYRGGPSPELVEDGARWRFLDCLPERITETDQIPPGLREILENLRRQACLAQGLDPDADSTARSPGAEADLPNPPAGAAEAPPDGGTRRFDAQSLAVAVESGEPPGRRQRSRIGEGGEEDGPAATDEAAPDEDATTGGQPEEGLLPLPVLLALTQIADLRRRHQGAPEGRELTLAVVRSSLPGWKISETEGDGFRIEFGPPAVAVWLTPPTGKAALGRRERARLKLLMEASLPLLAVAAP